MSPWLSNGNWAENLSLSLSYLSQARDATIKIRTSLFLISALFFFTRANRRARGRRDGRERPAAQFFMLGKSLLFFCVLYLKSSPFFSKNTHSHTHKTYARDDVFVLFFAAAATARNGDDSAVVFFRRSMRFGGGNRAVPARQSVLRELSVPEKRGFLPMERGRGYFRRVF